MNTIHKYELSPSPGIQSVKIREKAVFLKMAVQSDKICLWYQVDTFEAWQEINFILYHTGQELDNELHHRCRYIDTLLFNNGNYVLHIYKINS